YYIQTTNNVSNKVTTGTTKYYYDYDANYNSYYVNAAGNSIFAYSSDVSAYVKAKLNTSNKLVYQPQTYKKVTTTNKIKVEKTTIPVVKEIKVGSKGKVSYKYTDADGSGTTSMTRNLYLSGKSGKVKVTMGSNSKLMDIVVGTYDKNGNMVYKVVKNNKTKVAFGNYYSGYESNSSGYYASYYSKSSSLYKPTYVYVFYKDKLNGTYTDIKSVKYNKKTKTYTIKYKYKDSTTTKAVTETASNLPSSNCMTFAFYR
ncbi:MAG: hypothetical protein K5675_06685, partial [Lachnospiraceae bacterium]|nr:hypothetical protein [Lachnospiraceae bacterium]